MECRTNKKAVFADTITSITYLLVPILSVPHGARAVEFYRSAFGAVEVFKIESSRRCGGGLAYRLSRAVVSFGHDKEIYHPLASSSE